MFYSGCGFYLRKALFTNKSFGAYKWSLEYFFGGGVTVPADGENLVTNTDV